MQKFARKCSVTNKGMNEGFCVFDGETYLKDEYRAITYAKALGYDTLDEAYEDSVYYWTTWDIEEGEDCYDENGNVILPA